MPGAGHRHRLILYTYMLNRWWRLLLVTGVLLLLLTAGLGGIPLYFPRFPVVWVTDWILWIAAGAGGLCVLGALFMAGMRKSAYVQPLADHLRLVTPFLRLNIAYRRIRSTHASEMQQLFPIGKLKGLKRELLRPLAKRTAVVVNMHQLPLSRSSLGMFLSPFFFPDRTPRLAILVSDWMAFSTEMDSLRSTWQSDQRRAPVGQGSSSPLLDGLANKPRQQPR